MENTNNIVSNTQPPFETSSGGSLDKGTLTSYQKKIYNDALAYATKNNDPSPKTFAEKAAVKTQVSYGKNNPFGDLASKSQSGTIKNGIKYRDYPTIEIPLSKQYEQHIQEQNNQQLEQQQELESAVQDQEAAIIEQEQQSIPQEPQQFQQQQNNTQLPQQQPQSIYDRNYSDQQVQSNNSTEQLDVMNPIKQFGCGGSMKKSYEAGGHLNSYDVGGLHEENPLGGIPQGIGSNGKQNTVEQGETSHTIDGKKFIFSNRIYI